MSDLVKNLLLSSFMVVLLTGVHFFGLIGLVAIVWRDYLKKTHSLMSVWIQGGAIVGVVIGLFALHAIEIWLFAVIYLILGEFDTLEAALYFSTATFTTVGFGDVYLDEKWRLLSAVESAAGFLLLGWSTAFLVSLTTKLRILETALDPPKDHPKEGED